MERSTVTHLTIPSPSFSATLRDALILSERLRLELGASPHRLTLASLSLRLAFLLTHSDSSHPERVQCHNLMAHLTQILRRDQSSDPGLLLRRS